jgi:hypothetical protein
MAIKPCKEINSSVSRVKIFSGHEKPFASFSATSIALDLSK